MSIILLIGEHNDPHIEFISKELTKLKEKFVIIDDFTIHDSFTVEFDKGLQQGEIAVYGQRYSMNKIRSVWSYSPISIVIDKKMVSNSYEFIRAEWTEGFWSVWNSIHAKWVNHPSAAILASNKLKQLQLASVIGLSTPKTLITNNPSKFLKFFEECNYEVIAKTLHGSRGLQDNKLIFTTKITKNDVKHANKLIYSPCMFQQYVPKKTELRVTIVGNILRTVEIHSQKSKKTMHDWRRYDDFTKTPYTITNLPNRIESKLLRLMRTMNLEFGAVDLIKTPDEEIVFLEVNPNGRWLWIQELTGINIAKDIAYFLAND